VLYGICEGLYFLGEPNISPPMTTPLQIRSAIIAECGHEVEVMQPIAFPFTLLFTCSLHNGSDVNGTLFYKDGVLLSDMFYKSAIQADNEDDLYGTYTFVVTTERCGSTHAITRILYQG